MRTGYQTTELAPFPEVAQGGIRVRQQVGGIRTLVGRVTTLQLDEAKEPCEMIERRCDLNPVVVPGLPPTFRS